MAKSKKQDKKLLKVHHSYEPEAMAHKWHAPVQLIRDLARELNNSVQHIEDKLRELKYSDGTENPPAAPPFALPVP